MLQKILELLYNIPITLSSYYNHLCCLEIMENKVSVSGEFGQQGEEQATSSDLSIGNESPLQAYLWKKGGIGISLFTTHTDKRLSHMMHPASKYKESRQLSRHST